MDEVRETSYDAIPYESFALPETHPDRLSALARLFGMEPPGLDACRVLELGCAAGGNLIPLALAMPDARFLGALTGEALAKTYAAADAFVFPSLTDTFGIVLLEALACGVPVAAYPVTGPLDVIGGTGAGALDHDLRAAALAALAVPRARCRQEALRYTWAESARQFYENIALAHALGPMRAIPRRRFRAGAAEASADTAGPPGDEAKRFA